MFMPEPKMRVIVKDGTPWKPDVKPTRVGALGVVLRRGVYVGTGGHLDHECWVLIDGDGCPTTLWSSQLERVPLNTHPEGVHSELVERWIQKFEAEGACRT